MRAEDCEPTFDAWRGPAVLINKNPDWRKPTSILKKMENLVLQYIEPELHFTAGHGEYGFVFFIFKQGGNWFLSFSTWRSSRYYLGSISTGSPETEAVEELLYGSQMFPTFAQLSGRVNGVFREDFNKSKERGIREAGYEVTSKIMTFEKTRGVTQ